VKFKLSEDTVLLFSVKLILIGLIASWFTRITNFPAYWPGVLLLFLFSLIKNRSVFGQTLVLLPFSVGLLLMVFDGFDHYKNVPLSYLFPFGPFTDIYPFVLSAVILINIEFSNNKENVIFELKKFSLFCFLVGLCLSFITEISYPGISRERDLSKVSSLFWSMSFGMFYSLPFVAIIVLNKIKGFYKHLLSFLLIVFCAFSGFLTLTIFMLVGVLIAYYESVANGLRNFFILFLIVLGGFFIFTVGGIGSFGVSLLNLLPNDAFIEKADQLLEINSTANGNVEDLRGNVYSVSLNSFYDFPFFGTGDYSEGIIGYHSFWLDKLGFIGFFGTIPYLLVLFQFYRYINIKYFNNNKLWLKINILLFILLFLNPFQFWDFWIIIYVILPILNYGTSKNLYNVKLG